MDWESLTEAENGAEWAKNRVERSRVWRERGRKRESGSGARNGMSQSGNEAESGLNRPLTARSNVTFN